MKSLKVSFENCFGICKLEAEFDFKNTNSCTVYAPNGVMKTSFAKSFKELSEGRDPRDLIFSDRISKFVITDENDSAIPPEYLFVIEPYNEEFSSEKLSTLLVSAGLKKEYDEIYQELETDKKTFITKLKTISQSTDCEAELTGTFKATIDPNIFEIFRELNKGLDGKQPKYEFRYNEVFDKKGNVKKFLDKHKNVLQDYIAKYEELITESKFFKKSDNSFGTYQATDILKSISDNSYFDAGHVLTLSDSTKINSAEEYKSHLETEINKVLSDEKLKNIFDKIEKALGSSMELRTFKRLIEKNKLLLIDLKDYEVFKQKVWKSFLDQLRSDVQAIVAKYIARKKQITDIINKAISEETEWEKAVKEYNSRFKGLPFTLGIKNKPEVLLDTVAPSVIFNFHDQSDQKEVDKDQLLSVLSQGERRALYLLNIIFEIRARKNANQQTVFVIDDIADSFDYKNKYAIIEYLKDISDVPYFYQIILTHNFDFFRTLESRGIVGYEYCYYTYKTKTAIVIEKATGGIRNPFINDWKQNLHDDKKLTASIPFIRNIIEYTKGDTDPDYIKLTSLLHWKEDTEKILIKDIKQIFEKTISNCSVPTDKLTSKVVDILFQVADQCMQAPDGMNFENKIVLSIAIRLKSEKFLIDKINNPDFVNKISKNQTFKLVKKYKGLFPHQKESVELFELVNLMTPENIHVNSFMYEPIIDLGIDHLKDLYGNIKNLSN